MPKIPGSPPPAVPPGWRIEPNYVNAYQAYAADPSPTNTDAMLAAADPILRMGVSTYGNDSPIMRGHARRIAVESLPRYDPTKAGLKTHLMSHLQGLQRLAARRDRVLSVPERMLLDRNRLRAATAELADDLGRDPSDSELADRVKIPMKRIAEIRKYRPAVTHGQVASSAAAVAGSPDAFDAAVRRPGGGLRRAELLYHDLSPPDQVILERTLGLRGKPVATGREIAAALGISPSAVAQRAARIQAQLDELQDMGID